MTAPVSLAKLRAAIEAPDCYDVGHYVKWTELEALVELAEAYLAVRNFDQRPKGMGFGGEELQQAHERLALAAKGVRP